MKYFKKIAAAVLVAVMALAVTGCHKKNETAVTIGDFKFTSAYYMCALIHADSEARSLVDEALSEASESEDESSSSQTEEVDYYSQKVEDTDYVKWVKNRAIETLKEIAAYKTKCKDAELELEDDVTANAKQYAEYYWSSYGYSQLFEPNGVGKQTYIDYMLDSYYSSLYFEHLYGEGGEKEIAAADVNAAMLENFVIADMIEVSFSDKENTEITASKEQMNTYVTALQKGTMTFEEVYKAYNNITEDTDTSTETETDDETSEPMDKYAQILGKEETAYASDYFETALAMKNGEVKLIELENEAGLVLLVKKDINADPYYAKNLDITVRNILKGDEYEDDIKSYAEKLDCDISNYAINNFKVKKIVYPETNSY